MEYTNNINYWNKIKNNKKGSPLTYIHTPKCGGSFVGSVLSSLNIKNKGHNRGSPKDGITFTVIRKPIERFESLMNYRLNETKPRADWPKSLSYVYKDKTINLNQIIKQMSDKNIMNFSPYKSLCYWSKNIDIFITIDQLEDFLSCFEYDIDISAFQKKNVSKKTRGRFNENTKKRIAQLYSKDITFYNNVIQ